jgi:serine/threonine-protein kinase
MSPEQVRGLAVDRRADIWAFGCVLYEFLTGASPFAGASIPDVIAGVLEREPDWNALPLSTPRPLVRLIQRCLQKDTKRRLRDIADARLDLDEALTTPPTTLVRATSVASLPWPVVAAAAVTIAVSWWLFSARNQIGPHLSRAVRLTNSAAREFSPAISPDNKWVAYYSEWQGRSDVWVKFLDSGSTLNLTSSLNLDLSARALIGGLSISPDGTMIAVASRSVPGLPGYDTWIIPAPAGGVPRKLLSTLQAMQWSPDGKQIACVRAASSRGDALVVADSDGGNQRDVVPARGGRHVHWPAWSRDQKWIYFISSYDTWQSGQSEIYRVPTSGGSDEPVIITNRRAIYPAPVPGGGLIFAANPDAIDLSLWWSDGRGHAPRQLTIGVGEYSEQRLSDDGSRMVATVTDTLQSAIYRIPASESGRMVRVTDGFSGDVDPSVDPRHDRMAFASARSGHRNLWLAKVDGTDPHPLTTADALDERPAFSHDGQQIAFVSDRGGQQGIWVVDADGGAPRLLTHTRVLDTLTWSRDNARVLYAVPGGDMPHVESVAVATGRVDTVALPTPAVVPTWSPTSDVIAYLDPSSTGTASGGRMALTIANAQGRRLFESTGKEAFTNGFIAWSPDGTRIAGVRFPANAAGSIWVVDPTGTQPPRKLIDLPVSMRPHGLAWTSDGSSVLLSGVEVSSDIVLFDVAR